MTAMFKLFGSLLCMLIATPAAAQMYPIIAPPAANQAIGAQGWLESAISSTESIAQRQSISTSGGIGDLGACRTSDNPQAGSMGCQGQSAFAINDNAAKVQTAYGVYVEVRRKAGAGSTQGFESNALNGGTIVDIYPDAMTTTGLTTAGWFSAGRTDTTLSNGVSAALGIINNGARFQRGIVFGSNALASTYSEMLTGDCAHNVAWYTSTFRMGSLNCSGASFRVQSASSPFSFDMIRAQASGADTADGDILGRERFYSVAGGTPVLASYAQATKRASGSSYTVAAINDTSTTIAVSLMGYGNNSFAPSAAVALGSSSNPWGTVYGQTYVPASANSYTLGNATTRFVTSYANPNVVVRTLTAGASIAVNATDYLIIVRKTSGSSTSVTLPASPETGRTIVVKDGKGDAASSPITITPTAGTIDGAASYVINAAHGVARLAFDGSEWVVL